MDLPRPPGRRPGPFLRRKRPQALTLHGLARTYGKLPSELLDLNLWDFGFNLEVASFGQNEEERQMRKAQR